MTLDIKQYIQEKNYHHIRKLLNDLNTVEISELIDELEGADVIVVFRLLPKDEAADVFAYLSSEQQENIINTITDVEMASIIEDLYFDDMIDIIEEMPANVVKKILKNTKVEERPLINQFLNYPDHSAGSIMTIEYVDLKKSMTVEEAIRRIRKTGIDKETINTCYVTDKERHLEGIVSLRTLITSADEVIVDDIMTTNYISVHATEDQEEVAMAFKKFDLSAIPVLDTEGRLLGIITFDDIMDVVDQENTEDFHKMAGIAPSEESYLDSSVFSMARQRILWLMVLMISATFTGRIIQRYEEVLQSVVILAAFIPMLMDTGGNAGSQSSTMVIRSLALGDITPKDVLKVIRKEITISFIVGGCLALLNFGRLLLFEKVPHAIALTVTLTLFLTVVLAKAVGSALPIIAKIVKVDPAVMASPLITTIVDAVALVVYFQLASVLLGL
ncbi:MAG: magnesium transporter [Peptostreptococcaceae bacterium]|nr:magnesium transporter [Peptostreptococcaceae bacterium]